MTTEELKQKIEELEAVMSRPDFWQDKARAQLVIEEHKRLKAELTGISPHERSDAIITIFSGAGGDDAEDFSRLLFQMYLKFAGRHDLGVVIHHENQNDHGGFRNVTFLLRGRSAAYPSRGAYGILKGESGVHRLVRVSPFSAKKLRHTSFSLVEVVPALPKNQEVVIPPEELKVEFARAGGPGGQNVNKRETAVRLIHLPTGLTVHCESERSQERNRERALEILRGKLYKRREDERFARERGMYISKTTDIEWGSQIRSYVLHPYKLIKDHRTGVETSNVEAVLEEGKLENFIDAELKIS